MMDWKFIVLLSVFSQGAARKSGTLRHFPEAKTVKSQRKTARRDDRAGDFSSGVL
jgi:hypothetical protein